MTCNRCHVERPITKFRPVAYVRQDGTRAREAMCRVCLSNATKARYNLKPLHERRELWRRRRWVAKGISVDYTALFTAQNGLCAICHEPEHRLTKDHTTAKALSVDHDHKTGIVRGLLCHDCNIGLGVFKDNPVLLDAAKQYLNINGR